MVEILKPSNKSCSSLNFVQKSPRGQMSIFPRSRARGTKILYDWNITFIEMAKNTFHLGLNAAENWRRGNFQSSIPWLRLVFD